MKYTYDLNNGGVLILKADAADKRNIEDLRNEVGEFDLNAEYEALEELLCNSELEWIEPEEIGALTSAPILGFRNYADDLNPDCPEGEVVAAWAFMDYQVRSFLDDLLSKGQAIFVS